MEGKYKSFWWQEQQETTRKAKINWTEEGSGFAEFPGTNTVFLKRVIIVIFFYWAQQSCDSS